MTASKIAKRYAVALIEFAEEQNLADIVLKDMSVLIDTNKQDSTLFEFLRNPAIEDGEKTEILKNIFKEFNKISLDFISLLIKNKRTTELISAANAYKNYYNQEKGIYRAVLTTAIALGEEENNSIINKVKMHLGYSDKELDVQKNIDPEILGGFIMQIKDKQIDSSIRTRIYQLKKDLQIP